MLLGEHVLLRGRIAVAQARQAAPAEVRLEGFLAACAAEPGGDVLVGAQSKLVTFSPGGGTTEETLNTPVGTSAPYLYFTAVAMQGSYRVAAAPNGRLFISQNQSAFEQALELSPITNTEPDGFRGLVVLPAPTSTPSDLEGFAFGSETVPHPAARLLNAQWSFSAPPVSGYSYWSAVGTGSDTVFVGGGVTSSFDGVILKGRRTP